MYRLIIHTIVFAAVCIRLPAAVEPDAKMATVRHGIKFSSLSALEERKDRATLGIKAGVVCYAGTFELTQKQWSEITGESFAEYLKRKGREIGDSPPMFIGESLPVYYLDYEDALKFIEVLNRKEDESDDNLHWVFFIPSKSQWEVAARSGSKSKYLTGDHLLPRAGAFSYRLLADERKAVPEEWHKQARELKTPSSPCEVGSRSIPNSSGLYDIHGNMAELTSTISKDVAAIHPELRGVDVRIRKGGHWKSSMYACAFDAGGWSSFEFSRLETGLRVFALVSKK